jgi:hypothetical protein
LVGTSGYLARIGAGTGARHDYASPLSNATSSRAVTAITIQAGSLGGGFSGTIWFDDFRIE